MVQGFPSFTASHITSTVAEYDRLLSTLEGAAEGYRKAMASGGLAHEAAYVVLREPEGPQVMIWRELRIGDVILSTVWAGGEIDRERKVIAWHRSTLDGSALKVARSVFTLAEETAPDRR